MSFLFYDLTFLVIFAIFVSIFLHSGKKNIKKEGLLLLYKASWGIKLINYVGKKSPKTFRILSYISITIGYILMVGMLFLLGRIVYLYTFPSFVQAIKIPPLLPLVPYLPQVFGLSFLPPFYFTYWIIVLVIIAIPHEFAHGIFAAYNKIKIKSTGFGFFPFFFPVFLAAFVEPDEKKMEKKSIFSQLAVLSAGTFANLLTAILFFGFLWIFFSLAFAHSGVVFDTYPYTVVSASSVTMINGLILNNPTYGEILNLSKGNGFNKLEAGGQEYITKKSLLKKQQNDKGKIILYYDAPAIRANLESVIFKIDGVAINNLDDLKNQMSKYSPGEKITLNVLGKDGKNYDRDIILGENPKNKSLPWIGIGFSNEKRSGAMGKMYSVLNFKKPHIYYRPLFDTSVFIYNLLWWIALISISVALINMLPMGIFDGGKFFYLTVLAITKKEKIAKNMYTFSTFFILLIFLILMLLWAFLFF